MRRLPVALMLAAVAAPAVAAPVDTARCFLVANLFAKAAKDQKGQQIAAFVRFYNLGRLQATLPDAALKKTLMDVGRTIKPDAAAAAMNDCAKTLEASDKAIEVIGAELQQQAVKK